MSAFRGGGNSNKGGGFGGGSGPSATSTVIRRLYEGTPPKNNPNGNNSGAGPPPNNSNSNSSSSSPHKSPKIIVNGFELPSGVPDLTNLTAEKRLVMIQRLMRDEFTGWDQLMSESPSDESNKKNANEESAPAPPVTTADVKKNLREAFMESETMLSSGVSVIRGNGGANRFVETATTTTVEEGLGLEEEEEQAREEDGDETLTTIRSGLTEEEDEYQPEFCKLIDDLMMAHDHYKVFLERAIEAVVEKNFEEVFPEAKVTRLFGEIDGFMKALEAFSCQSPAENMKLFFPSDSKKSPKKAVLNCPVEQQEELVATVYKLSKIMATLSDQMKSDKWKNMEAGVDEKLHLHKKTVDKMERDLKDLEKRKKSILEGYSLLTTFADHNISGSSGDILNLE